MSSDFSKHTNSELMNIMNSEHKMLEPLKRGATKEWNKRKKLDRTRIAARKQRNKINQQMSLSLVNQGNEFVVGEE